MSLPEILYGLFYNKKPGVIPRIIQGRKVESQSSTGFTCLVTVPEEYDYIITNISVVGAGGGAQNCTQLRAVSNCPDGSSESQIRRDIFTAANTVCVNWSGLIWLPKDATFGAQGNFSAAALANSITCHWQGLAVPTINAWTLGL